MFTFRKHFCLELYVECIIYFTQDCVKKYISTTITLKLYIFGMINLQSFRLSLKCVFEIHICLKNMVILIFFFLCNFLYNSVIYIPNYTCSLFQGSWPTCSNTMLYTFFKLFFKLPGEAVMIWLCDLCIALSILESTNVFAKSAYALSRSRKWSMQRMHMASNTAFLSTRRTHDNFLVLFSIYSSNEFQVPSEYFRMRRPKQVDLSPQQRAFFSC